ncbi:MAG TPA: HdeD family acid-resistance protein [Burkholderiales bacterium]|nr:HdeD family acid-resistance protein [Burkholderiales bacterium]
MDQLLLRSWWMLALRGAAALLFGILALIWPGITLLVLVALFAAYALISGAVSVVAAVRHRNTDKGWWLILLFGIVSLVAGVIAVFNPDITIFVLVLLMGANAIVTGILDIVVAIRLRKQIEREWLLALAGVVSLVFGVLVFLFPAAGALAMVFMVSFYATLSGILLLVLAFRARKWVKRSGPQADVSSRYPRQPAT